MISISKSIRVFFAVCVVAGFSLIINSCTHAAYVLPENLRVGDPTICFESDILPIFISNCTKSGCHDAASHKSGYALDNYTDIMKKGIIPGNVAASVIWQTVAIKKIGITVMPVEAPGLTATDLDLLRRWIASGAIDSGACNAVPCDSNNFTYSTGIEPMVQKYCTGCHSSSSSSGGSLMDYNSVKAAAVSGRLLGDIQHLSGYNNMPLGGIALTECQVAQFTKWVAAGALNN